MGKFVVRSNVLLENQYSLMGDHEEMTAYAIVRNGKIVKIWFKGSSVNFDYKLEATEGSLGIPVNAIDDLIKLLKVIKEGVKDDDIITNIVKFEVDEV